MLVVIFFIFFILDKTVYLSYDNTLFVSSSHVHVVTVIMSIQYAFLCSITCNYTVYKSWLSNLGIYLVKWKK